MFTCPTHPNTNSKKNKTTREKESTIPASHPVTARQPLGPCEVRVRKKLTLSSAQLPPCRCAKRDSKDQLSGILRDPSMAFGSFRHYMISTQTFFVPKKVGHPKNEPKFMSLISDCSSAQMFGAVKFARPLSWSKQNTTGAPVLLPLHRRHQGC